MSYNWDQYHIFAESLYKKAQSGELVGDEKDTYYRNFISRAYYSVLIRARNYIDKIDNHSYGSGIHTLLPQHLIDKGGELGTIGNRLKLLKIEREMVDYDNTIGGNESLVKKAEKVRSWVWAIKNSLDELNLCD